MVHKALFLSLIILAIALGSVGAAIAYFLSALITELIVVDLSVAALALWSIAFGLTKRFAGSFGVARPKRWATVVSTLSLASVAAILAAPTLAERWSPVPDNANSATIKALAETTLPLTTVQPESGFDDLQPLKPVLDGKRIIALGEATHGTREFFKMKHRLLEFLVREMGYEHFGLETSAEVAQVINDYISGGQGKPQAVLYWPWATVEVMDMLDWMRAYNANPQPTHKLIFYGIDPTAGERDRGMAENVSRILEHNGPQSKIVLWAHNAHISNAAGRLGHYLKQQFGDQAYLLGFEFNEGTFTSRMMTVHTYRVEAASPAYYAYALAKVNQPILYLDFRLMSRHPELREWLAKDQRSHEFQELHALYRLHPAWHTLSTSWLNLYDGVIFIEASTPAIGLQ